jgi:signal peptidase II
VSDAAVSAVGAPVEAGVSLRRLKVAGVVVLVLAAALDLGTKAWMADLLHMDPGRPREGKRIDVVPGFFALEGTFNPGVTFGLAPGQTVPILVFTLLATGALGAWLFLTRQASLPLHVGLGMVLGGALGNLWDRLQWTKVRDFLLFYVGDLKWPNFNLADACIVVGVGLILWDELFGRRRRERRRTAGGAGA